MIHVTLTQNEIDDIGRWQPAMPPDYWPALALAKKGIRFRPTFSAPREDDMMPPWRVWIDPSDSVLHVWQGAAA